MGVCQKHKVHVMRYNNFCPFYENDMKFEDYSAFVDGKVIPEPHGYTMLRCALEVVEEYMEYLEDPSSKDEFGDCLFWFTYFCNITEYDPNIFKPQDVKYPEMSKTIQMFMKYIKRFYRDSEIKYIEIIKEEIMPSWYFWLRLMAVNNFPALTMEDIAYENMLKLTKRYG